jgi:RNA polymerase subunit RPABC4/transcription elongation factor Spt4
MPTFKHPCPYCDKFIDRSVAACPFCGQADPFAPKRCLTCRKIVEDPSWVVCPSCGNSLIAPVPVIVNAAPGATTTGSPAAATVPTTPATPVGGTPGAPAAPPPPRPALNADAAPIALKSAGPCGGCGSPLPAGARFCTVCGTVAG